MISPHLDPLIAGRARERVARTACSRGGGRLVVVIVTAWADALLEAGGFVERLSKVDGEDEIDVVLTVHVSDVVQHLAVTALSGAVAAGKWAGF